MKVFVINRKRLIKLFASVGVIAAIAITLISVLTQSGQPTAASPGDVITNAVAPEVAQSENTVMTAVSGKKIPIYNVQKTDKVVALTFDAAWGNEDTDTLIDVLHKYNAKATFFVTGQWVDHFPDSVKALFDAGNEIGNHSNTHPHMAGMSRDNMIAQIANCNKKVEAITNTKVTDFRAPYGEYTNNVLNVATALSMNTIQWDVDKCVTKLQQPYAHDFKHFYVKISTQYLICAQTH